MEGWILAAEATRRWGLGESTIRSAIHRKQFEPDEHKKIGRDWLVTISGMERLYGEERKMLKQRIEKEID